MTERLLTLKQVLNLTGVGETTLWRWQQKGLFPKPLKLHPGMGGAARYLESEILAWLEEKKAMRDGQDAKLN